MPSQRIALTARSRDCSSLLHVVGLRSEAPDRDSLLGRSAWGPVPTSKAGLPESGII